MAYTFTSVIIVLSCLETSLFCGSALAGNQTQGSVVANRGNHKSQSESGKSPELSRIPFDEARAKKERDNRADTEKYTEGQEHLHITLPLT